MKKPTFKGGPTESNSNLDPQIVHRLDPLAETLALIPLSGKIPLCKGWPVVDGYSIEKLLNHQNCTTIGARTGLFSGPLLCFDLDGESAWNWLTDRTIVFPETWVIARDNSHWKIKILFRPNAEQINRLPEREFTWSEKTSSQEQLEVFFMGGRQVAILGNHPSGGNYYWPEGFGPESLAILPDDWLKLAIDFSTKTCKRQQPKLKAITSKGDWLRSRHCSICNRIDRSICCIHKDGNTIRCFHGGTYSPPKGLNPGDLIDGTWAYVRDQVIHGIGVFSIFVRHKPSKRAQLQDCLYE